jgi:3-hydroxyacyl-CoA dehydrogenase/enoyl-CoA hydratase/3-hydroxybutyryl-CoA epimerase
MQPADLEALKHWRLSTGSSGHCWLTLDKAGSSSNTLSSDVVDEFGTVIGLLEQRVDLPGVVIRSAKRSGFILGADVNEFTGLKDPQIAASLAARGQALLRRLEELPFPTVAILNGYTLGGGLELALACRYRVAERGYERCIGLPEVQLGIHPGFGGTVRAVAIVGVPQALDLMLTGRSLSPFEARAIGLVDVLAPKGDTEGAALRLLRRRPPLRRASWYLRLLNARVVRPLLARRLRQRIARKARPEHYPAPHALIDLWERYGGVGAEAYRAEAASIGRLLVSKSSKNLVRLFLLRERLRNIAPKRHDVARVHVVGAGVMGGDIAAWCALQGLDVTVQDREEKYLQPAFDRARTLFRKRLKAPGAARDAELRLRGDIAGAGVAAADVIIEAIIEDLEAKRELFATIEASAGPEAVLATNTSSIRIEEISAGLADPGRLVGIHYFNPVASMPLVEVIRTQRTDPDAFARALAFVTRTGKLPLPCLSAPGFVVNRILMPYMLEALKAHLDGHAIETIDAAAREFGMPMGPIELADQVGLDICLHVAEVLKTSLPRPMPDVPQWLRAKVTNGELGRKTGKGFYDWKDGEPVKERDAPPPTDVMTDRLILPMIDVCVGCLREGLVADSDTVDGAMIFATGFAPFRGGPLHYASTRGDVPQTLERLAQLYGERFRPDPGWDHTSFL